MRRLLRVRLLFVLVALLLVPALVMPYAERLRTEWARYWDPKAQPIDDASFVVDADLVRLGLLEQQMLTGSDATWEVTIIPFPDEPPLMYPDEELGYPFGNWREKLRERADLQPSSAKR